MVGELRILLHNVILQVDRADRMLWRLETSFVYTVRSAYNCINAIAPVDLMVPVSSLWHKDVPLKVGLLLDDCSVTGSLLRTTFIVDK